MTAPSQNELILAHLMRGEPIDPMKALKLYGCFRLGARVFDLKRDGHAITATIITNKKTGKHFAEYRMTAAKKAA